MKFDIQPQDLQTMISKLQMFSSQMQSLSNSMQATARSLGASWKDPQYIAFITSIDSMAKNMKGNSESFNVMRTNLQTLKRNLERSHQEYRKLNR